MSAPKLGVEAEVEIFRVVAFSAADAVAIADERVEGSSDAVDGDLGRF